MRIKKTAAYAILTGDVVGSARLSPAARRALPRTLARIGTNVRRVFGPACPLPLDVFRGDSWQLLVGEPAAALRVALFVRASLRAELDARADTRVAIGIGGIEFLPGNSVTRGDGPAYRRSGASLDEMPRQVRLAVRGADGDREPLVTALVVATDALTRRWTPSQARAVLGALADETQETIGAAWRPAPITQQAVAQHLSRAQWYAVERALGAFEAEVAVL